jgi:hypothetical protein
MSQKQPWRINNTPIDAIERAIGVAMSRSVPARVALIFLGLTGALAGSFATAPQANAHARDLRFETGPAMFAANEEWLTFACERPEGQVAIGSAKSVEMYYYSRYGLGNLLIRSGMGVQMVYNPLFADHIATDEGMPW